jgi:hypothetical protein
VYKKFGRNLVTFGIIPIPSFISMPINLSTFNNDDDDDDDDDDNF